MNLLKLQKKTIRKNEWFLFQYITLHLFDFESI